MLMAMTMGMGMARTGVDRISSLPDAMLCHILSFLPTKVVVTTSVLSKRWVRLWLFVPTLDFEEDDDPIKFFRMVYIVMFNRDVTQSVKRFRLSTSVNSIFDNPDVNTWVKAAMQLGVEHLDLWLPSRINMPSGILGSRMLVVLKLGQLLVNDVFTDGFPSLKVLHLDHVHFEQHRHLMHLIFGCPILEDLYVDDLDIDDLKPPSNDNLIIGGEFQSLNKLVSANVLISTTCIPLKWICNVKSLRIHEEFYPDFKVTCTFHSLTSLKLIVDIYNWGWFFKEVLQQCPKLQHFEITHTNACEAKYIDGYGKNWEQPKFVPECLSSHLRTCTLRGYRGWYCELQYTEYIMQNAKVLRTMRICSENEIFSNPLAKHRTIKKLSLFPWSSAHCALHLDLRCTNTGTVRDTY